MRPTLFEIGAFAVPSYSVLVALAFVVAAAIKRAEERRLGYGHEHGYRFVGVGALLGAVVGSKLGLLLYVRPEAWSLGLASGGGLPFDGKTILGALFGGYLGVEIAKRIVGITHSTGDAFAIALPVGQAIGRVGCLLEGCCYGAPSDVSWAVFVRGAERHPVQAYEACLDLGLAIAIAATRSWTLAEGVRFRLFLVGYAVIRFSLDPFRGDERVTWAGLSLPQIACALLAIGFGASILLRGPRLAHAGR